LIDRATEIKETFSIGMRRDVDQLAAIKLSHQRYLPERDAASHVRFGSKADMCGAQADVR
jgi:hypothetical protein